MTTGSPQSRVYYGWTITAVCVLVYFFTNGMTIFVPQNFFPRLMEDFSADAGQVSLTATISFLVTALVAPFVGALIDRAGVIRVIRTGLVVLAVCFCLYPFAASLQQLYLLHVGFAFGLALCGLMPNVVLLSAWFVRRRGLVIGLLTSASSLAGGILPLAVAPLTLNPEFGWRWGYGALAIAFLVLACIPGFLLLRSSPTVMGLWPDGDPAPPTDRVQPRQDGVAFSDALRSRTLWALAVGSACLWYSMSAMNSQVTIFFEQEANLSPANATLLFASIFWFSLGGKFLFGALSDYLPKQRVMLMTSSLLLIGCMLVFSFGPDGLELTTSSTQLLIFTTVFGLGFGGSFTMIQLVAVECFGQRDLGKILGIIIFVDSLGGAAGIQITGQMRAGSGSYLEPFIGVVIVAVIAVIGVTLIKPVTANQRVSAQPRQPGA